MHARPLHEAEQPSAHVRGVGGVSWAPGGERAWRVPAEGWEVNDRITPSELKLRLSASCLGAALLARQGGLPLVGLAVLG